jgi:hypothetical protein
MSGDGFQATLLYFCYSLCETGQTGGVTGATLKAFRPGLRLFEGFRPSAGATLPEWIEAEAGPDVEETCAHGPQQTLVSGTGEQIDMKTRRVDWHGTHSLGRI